MTRFAFFDLDGPLLNCFTIYEYGKYLNDRGLFNEPYLKRIEESLQAFKADKLKYDEFARRVVTEFGLALKYFKTRTVKGASLDFLTYINRYKRTYANDLVSLFKSHEYTTVVISGTPIEVAPVLTTIFGFDLTIGTSFETIDGIYTGRIALECATPEGKEKCFNKFLEKNDVDLVHSFGFGDSVSDLSFLSRVGYAIALNPSEGLSEIARENRWLVLSEDDRIMEKLEDMIGGIENGRHS